MNLVGKILTVLIFVMSLVFMSFVIVSYAAHKNWRAVVMNRDPSKGSLGLNAELENRDHKLKDMQNEAEKQKKDFDEQLAALRQENNNLQEGKRVADEGRTTAEKQLATETEAKREAVGARDAMSKTLEDKEKELVDIRTRLRAVDKARSDLFTEKVELSDKLHNALTEVVSMKEQVKAIGEQYAKAEAVLRAKGLKSDSPTTDAPPRIVDGLVVAVSAGGRLEISLGTDDGVLRGHLLEVFRFNEGTVKYVTRVRVVETTTNRSICQNIPEMQKSQPQKGDRVASELK